MEISVLPKFSSKAVTMRQRQRTRPAASKKQKKRAPMSMKKDASVSIKKEASVTVKKEPDSDFAVKKASAEKRLRAAAAAVPPPSPPAPAQQRAARMGGLVRTRTGGRRPSEGTFTRLLLRIKLARERGRRVSAGQALEDWTGLASDSRIHGDRLLSPGDRRGLFYQQDEPHRDQLLRLLTGGRELASLSLNQVSMYKCLKS